MLKLFNNRKGGGGSYSTKNKNNEVCEGKVLDHLGISPRCLYYKLCRGAKNKRERQRKTEGYKFSGFH